MTGYALWGNHARQAVLDCLPDDIGGPAIGLGGPFTLIGKDGNRVNAAKLITRPTLVYFGYTYCPDICPVDMARNGEVLDIMEGAGNAPNLLFITVDPGRDTPTVVGDFAESIHPDAIGLTGSRAEIDRAVEYYRAYYRINDDGTDYYPVDHTTHSYLVIPETGGLAYFRRDAAAPKMAKAISCLVDGPRR